MLLHKFVDVPISHPLRYHHEPRLSHRHAYERQHIWMAESPPCNNLPAEPLRDTVSCQHNEPRVTPNPLFQFPRGHPLSTLSKPWLQPPCRDVDPSTHPHAHQSLLGSYLGCNKVELPMIAEPGLGGYRCRIWCAHTSLGSVEEDCPTPNRQGAGVGVGVNVPIPRR